MSRFKEVLSNFWHRLDRDEKAIIVLPMLLILVILISALG